MSNKVNLLRLFNSAPKDERNRFIKDPRTDAFFEGLAKSTPLNPPQLLEHAEKLHKYPALATLAQRIVLQAIGDIGHDRRVLEILSKVADEQTAWGLPARDLLAKITKTYRGLSPRWTQPVGGWPPAWGGPGLDGPPPPTISFATTPPGSGCMFQPLSGPPVTLAPKQTQVFVEDFVAAGGEELPGTTTITVQCSLDQSLFITIIAQLA